MQEMSGVNTISRERIDAAGRTVGNGCRLMYHQQIYSLANVTVSRPLALRWRRCDSPFPDKMVDGISHWRCAN